MLDLRFLKDTYIYNEFDEVENVYWFDFKKKKFLHNIDTFYYSVKFKQDFTADSKDLSVKRFRRYFENIAASWEKLNDYDSGVSVFLPELPGTLNYKPFTFAGYYNICLECPEYFDMFFAPKVPHSMDDGKSVTCECVVQIRS